MLKLYLEELPNDVVLIDDMEYLFSCISLFVDDVEKRLVMEIEHGELIDDVYFKDRFGISLYLSNLSTGCKSALCVYHNKNGVLNLDECGINAQTSILSNIRNGSVYIPYNDTLFFNEFSSDDIDVCLDNYRFTSLKRLNYYISDERYLGVDMNMEGIYYV